MNYKKIMSMVLLVSTLFLSIGTSFADRSTIEINNIQLEKAEMKYKEILESRGFTSKYDTLDYIMKMMLSNGACIMMKHHI